MADHLPKKARQLMEQIKSGATEKQRRLLIELDTELGAMVPATGGGVMRVESMVSMKTKNPVVSFIWGTNKGMLSPIEAKGYALQILESCEAATQDASLYRAVMAAEKDKDPEEAEKLAFAMINMVRDNRAAFEQGGE